MKQQQIGEFVPLRWDGKKVDIDRRNKEKAASDLMPGVGMATKGPLPSYRGLTDRRES